MKFKLYQQKKDFVAGKSIVGIDPAKQHHQAAVITPFGLQIGKSFSFPVAYHESLWKKLYSIIPQQSPQNLLFAIETSCNLWKTIAFYLHANRYSVLLVNPLTTHHSRPLMSHDFSKTDPKDAFLVAKNAFDGQYDLYRSFTPQINQLSQLSIAYDKLIKDRNKYLLRIRSLIEIVFPEFLQFINLDTLTARFLLQNYFLPRHFIALDIESIAPIIAKISWGNYNKQLLVNLKQAAANTIGVDKSHEEQPLRIILTAWLVELNNINEQVKTVMDEMIALASQSEHFKILVSIKLDFGHFESSVA